MAPNILRLIAAAIAMAVPPAAARTSPAPRFGIATLDGAGAGCALIRDATVRPGEPVAIVLGGPRQRIVRAVVAGAATASCPGMPEGWAEAGDLLYPLRIAKGGRSADVASAGTLIRRPPASLRIRRDGRAVAEETRGAAPLLFRDCTSSEGAHHTVWSGALWTGRRVWHRYVYAGYDTVRTCRDRDFP